MLTLLEPGCIDSSLTDNQCCDEMPFKQPTAASVAHFIRGVEAGHAVVRYPTHASLISRAVAAVPRPLFDLWARRKMGAP